MRVRIVWAVVLLTAATPSGIVAEEAPAHAPQIAIEEADYVRKRVASCWDVKDIVVHPGLTREAQAQIRILLERDGSVSEIEAMPIPAHITNQSERDFHTLLNEKALRAVEACAPYILPPDKYEDWRKMKLNFSIAPISTPPIAGAHESGTLSDYDRKRIFGN